MIIKNWNILCLIKKVKFEQGLKKKSRSFHKWVFEGRVFQKEGILQPRLCLVCAWKIANVARASNQGNSSRK